MRRVSACADTVSTQVDYCAEGSPAANSFAGDVGNCKP